jgi:hypothetical protein
MRRFPRRISMKKISAHVILAGCLLGLLPARAAAWGQEGHRIVARLAAMHLTKKTQAAINKILSADKQDAKQCRKMKSIADKLACISTWPDDVRTPATAPFHFTDIPLDGGQYNEQRDCPAEGCSISALRDYSEQLKTSPENAERAIAIKFIVHLIGDLHQPLHNAQDKDRDFNIPENTTENHVKLNGDGHSDFGGNAKPVLWFEETRTPYGCFNLHSVWDDGIVNRSNPSDAAYANLLNKPYATKNGAAKLADIQGGSVVDWANEAFRLAVSQAYKLPEPVADDRVCEVRETTDKNSKKVCTDYTSTVCRVAEVHYRYHLGEAYYAENLPVVEKQLTRGGLRLAKYLNSILDPGKN